MKTILKKIFTSAAVVMMSCIGFNTSYAALLAYDPFDGGTVANGGTGWVAGWTASGNTLVGSSLSTGNGLTTSGGSNTVGFYGGGEAVRAFSATPITTGTLWMSWLQQGSGVTGGEPAQLRLMNGGTNLLTFGTHFNVDTSYKISSDDGSTIQANSGISVNGNHFVVASMEFSTGTVRLYIDPTGLGSGLAPLSAAQATWVSGTHFASGFNQIKTVGAGGTTMSLDEIRVGESWADVSPIPEPSTYALLGLGLAALIFLRRCKVA